MLTLGLIILTVILIIQNDNKNKEITKLYNELQQIKRETQSPNKQINYKPKIENIQNHEYIKTEYTSTKTKPSKTEINNNLILIVGSILIVLSAIVFLSTTWNITHSILKTAVIILMLVVFKIVERIASTKLKLPKTAGAFRYISLAYIPVVLMSIPFFKTLGEYFSFQGDGINLYLSIASIATTIIYYIEYKKQNDKITEIASLIFSYISVICTTAIFSSKMEIYVISLLIYSIAFSLSHIKNIKIYNSQTKYVTITSIAIITIALYDNLYNLTQENILFVQNISDILIFLNLYLLIVKIKKRDDIFNVIYPFLTIYTFFSASLIFESFDITKIYVIVSVLILYAYSLIKKDKIDDEITLQSLGAITLLFVSSVIQKSAYSYILPAIETIFLCISYDKSKIKKELSHIITAYILTTILFTILNLNLDYSLFGISAIFITLLSLVIDNTFQKSFRQIGDIAVGTFILTYHQSHLIALLLLTSYIISLTVYYSKTKDIKYKVLSYIYINPIIIHIMYLLGIKEILLFIPITATLVFLLETFVSKKDINKDIILAQTIISVITLNLLEHNIQNLIILLITNLSYITYIKKKNIKEDYLYPTLLSVIPYIITNNIYIFDYSVMHAVSLWLISTFIFIGRNKKTYTYDIIFYVYSLTHCIFFGENIYAKLALLIIGTTIIYINKKDKDIYKIILYLLSFVLFKNIFKDLNISHITMFSVGIYLIYISLITRTIIKKRTSDYKTLIYIGYILVNLTTIPNYLGEYDGILFNFLLTIIVIISYTKKYGPEFITSLVFILINTLLLTRTFWLSIPWWLYILIIGSILIALAIAGEIKENKINSSEKIQKLKRHLDL